VCSSNSRLEFYIIAPIPSSVIVLFLDAPPAATAAPRKPFDNGRKNPDESIVALFGVRGNRLAEFRLPPGHPQGGFNADGDRFVLTVSRTYLHPGLDVVYIYRLTGRT